MSVDGQVSDLLLPFQALAVLGKDHLILNTSKENPCAQKQGGVHGDECGSKAKQVLGTRSRHVPGDGPGR